MRFLLAEHQFHAGSIRHTADFRGSFEEGCRRLVCHIPSQGEYFERDRSQI